MRTRTVYSYMPGIGRVQSRTESKTCPHDSSDIVRAINDEEDYTKCRNYWKYLKGKFRKEGIELVSATNQFKFEAPDGKQRKADACNHGDRLLIFLRNQKPVTMSQAIR